MGRECCGEQAGPISGKVPPDTYPDIRRS